MCYEQEPWWEIDMQSVITQMRDMGNGMVLCGYRADWNVVDKHSFPALVAQVEAGIALELKLGVLARYPPRVSFLCQIHIHLHMHSAALVFCHGMVYPPLRVAFLRSQAGRLTVDGVTERLPG